MLIAIVAAIIIILTSNLIIFGKDLLIALVRLLLLLWLHLTACGCRLSLYLISICDRVFHIIETNFISCLLHCPISQVLLNLFAILQRIWNLLQSLIICL